MFKNRTLNVYGNRLSIGNSNNDNKSKKDDLSLAMADLRNGFWLDVGSYFMHIAATTKDENRFYVAALHVAVVYIWMREFSAAEQVLLSIKNKKFNWLNGKQRIFTDIYYVTSLLGQDKKTNREKSQKLINNIKNDVAINNVQKIYCDVLQLFIKDDLGELSKDVENFILIIETKLTNHYHYNESFLIMGILLAARGLYNDSEKIFSKLRPSFLNKEDKLLRGYKINKNYNIRMHHQFYFQTIFNRLKLGRYADCIKLSMKCITAYKAPYKGRVYSIPLGTLFYSVRNLFASINYGNEAIILKEFMKIKQYLPELITIIPEDEQFNLYDKITQYFLNKGDYFELQSFIAPLLRSKNIKLEALSYERIADCQIYYGNLDKACDNYSYILEMKGVNNKLSVSLKLYALSYGLSDRKKHSLHKKRVKDLLASYKFSSLEDKEIMHKAIAIFSINDKSKRSNKKLNFGNFEKRIGNHPSKLNILVYQAIILFYKKQHNGASVYIRKVIEGFNHHNTKGLELYYTKILIELTKLNGNKKLSNNKEAKLAISRLEKQMNKFKHNNTFAGIDVTLLEIEKLFAFNILNLQKIYDLYKCVDSLKVDSGIALVTYKKIETLRYALIKHFSNSLAKELFLRLNKKNNIIKTLFSTKIHLKIKELEQILTDPSCQNLVLNFREITSKKHIDSLAIYINKALYKHKDVTINRQGFIKICANEVRDYISIRIMDVGEKSTKTKIFELKLDNKLLNEIVVETFDSNELNNFYYDLSKYLNESFEFARVLVNFGDSIAKKHPTTTKIFETIESLGIIGSLIPFMKKYTVSATMGAKLFKYAVSFIQSKNDLIAAENIFKIAGNSIKSIMLARKVAVSVANKFKWQINKLSKDGINAFAKYIAIQLITYVSSNFGAERTLFGFIGSRINSFTHQLFSGLFNNSISRVETNTKLVNLLLNGIYCNSLPKCAKTSVELKNLSKDIDSEWTIEGIIYRSGIQTPDGARFYDPVKSNTSKYGFHLSSKQIAKKLNYRIFTEKNFTYKLTK
jgi:hypothetical protein